MQIERITFWIKLIAESLCSSYFHEGVVANPAPGLPPTPAGPPPTVPRLLLQNRVLQNLLRHLGNLLECVVL